MRMVAGAFASWRRAAGVVLAWGIAGLVISLTAPPLADVTTNSPEDFLPSNSESQRALELVAEKFPGSRGTPAIVVFHRPDGLSHEDLATVAEASAALGGGAGARAPGWYTQKTQPPNMKQVGRDWRMCS
ncbi:MAG: hypothetical protein F4Y02_17695, partial [Chloroflexi bacterium]|nr:hypothetical protein [Chloroflexota bacterium]